MSAPSRAAAPRTTQRTTPPRTTPRPTPPRGTPPQASPGTTTPPGDGHVADGRWAEDLVAQQYHREGFRIVDRNVRLPAGEIDIIVADPPRMGRCPLLIIAEVKYRATTADGGGVAAAHPRKRAHVRHLAAQWLATCRAQLATDPAWADLRAIDEIRIDIVDVGPEGIRGCWVDEF